MPVKNTDKMGSDNKSTKPSPELPGEAEKNVTTRSLTFDPNLTTTPATNDQDSQIKPTVNVDENSKLSGASEPIGHSLSTTNEPLSSKTTTRRRGFTIVKPSDVPLCRLA